MDQRISFRNVDIGADGYIRCGVVRGGEEEEFFIRLPFSYRPRHDLVAAALMAVCGKSFKEIHLDLPVGPLQLHGFEETSQASVTARPGVDVWRRPGTQTALNFSGGFDSFAAQVMLPDAQLVALDFGGKFSRERQFYQRFQPFTFETNLVDLGLNRYAWTFMGIGSLLLRDELDLGWYSFGSIQAASTEQLLEPFDQWRGRVPAADHLNMRISNPVAGVTEIGTMMMVVRNYPHLVHDILRSVALPAEEKFLRKFQMLEAIGQELGYSLALPQVKMRKQGLAWEYSMATDLSSLYVMKALGTDRVAASYPEGLPQYVVDAVPSLDLDFQLRVNPHAYLGVEPDRLADWLAVLAQNEILPYHRKDWDAVVRVLDLLGPRSV